MRRWEGVQNLIEKITRSPVLDSDRIDTADLAVLRQIDQILTEFRESLGSHKEYREIREFLEGGDALFPLASFRNMKTMFIGEHLCRTLNSLEKLLNHAKRWGSPGNRIIRFSDFLAEKVGEIITSNPVREHTP